MQVNIIKVPTHEDWDLAKRLALGTMGKEPVKPADDQWKIDLIRSEHSPLYTLRVVWEWVDLPYWVSVHLVRHHVGAIPFVKSQRNDRQAEYDRDQAPQGTPVLHREEMDLAAIMNTSKRRLCRQAALDTRMAWGAFLFELEKQMPFFTPFCVPHCVYRNGLCPEFKSCGANAELCLRHANYKELFKR